MPTPEISVVGLKETRKAFKDFDADKGWRESFKDAYRGAAGIAEDETKARASRGATTISGTHASMGLVAVASIKGKGTTTAATLTAFKGLAYPMGWNFGTTGRYRQFPTRAEPDNALYSGIPAKRTEIEETFLNEIGDALDQSFPDG